MPGEASQEGCSLATTNRAVCGSNHVRAQPYHECGRREAQGQDSALKLRLPDGWSVGVWGESGIQRRVAHLHPSVCLRVSPELACRSLLRLGCLAKGRRANMRQRTIKSAALQAQSERVTYCSIACRAAAGSAPLSGLCEGRRWRAGIKHEWIEVLHVGVWLALIRWFGRGQPHELQSTAAKLSTHPRIAPAPEGCH